MVALCSFGLIAIYVYDQAGGHILPWSRPDEERPSLLPSSKVKSAFPDATATPPASEAVNFMPGSKSAAIFDDYPQSPPPDAPVSEPAVEPAETLLPGSKGGLVPADRGERLLLPGSKSAPAPIKIKSILPQQNQSQR